MTQPTLLTDLNAEEVFGQRPPLVPEFHFLSEKPKGEAQSFLNYGGAGSGRTRFAGTAGDRALFIDNGNGFSTLQSPAFQASVGANPIIATLNEKLGKRGVFESAEVHDAICDTLDFALEKFSDRFDVVIIDDATQLRRGAMNKALEINEATNKSQTNKNIVERYDVVAPAVQDYGMEMAIVEQFVANYIGICKKAGKHFIMNAHERLTYRKGDKIGDPPVLVRTAPGFTGATFPDQIPSYFDNVWYFQALGSGNSRIYRITTQGHESLMAKTRMAGVFGVTEESSGKDKIDFKEVIRRIKETTTPKGR